MARLFLAIAAAIILGALLLLFYWVGKRIERARKLADARAIDPVLHNDLIAYVRGLLATPEVLGDDLVVLPTATRKKGDQLLARIAELEAAKMRAERRRVGY